MSRRVTVQVLKLFLLVVLVARVGLAAVGESADETAPRSLMISLDAVPYQALADLTDPALGEAAHFQAFHPPVPLISTFPSSTSVAMGGILGPLGLDRSPGYEARFFDWQQRRVRGGGLFSYFKVEFPWRDYFDWGRKGPVGSAIEAVRPIRAGIKRLRKALDDFLASDQQSFLIYIAATDTAAHVLDPEALKELLIELDVLLQEARSRSVPPFEVVIFSDHGIGGGQPLINIYKPIKRELREAGFEVKKRLVDENDVVLTPFGLVSNFEVYVEAPIADPVAQILVEVEGVDLCAFRKQETIWLVDRMGRASIERRWNRNELEWRYRSVSSDPIDYRPLIESLTDTKDADQEWVQDGDLLKSSRDGEYPDALYRIVKSFEMVLNPASIVCSVESDYMFGAPRTAALARFGKGRLRWTHGALLRQPSLGFLMSDAADWKPSGAVRFDQGLLPFVDMFRSRATADETP
ncbi:MAG: hypothetical protein P8Y44_00435 [Acidobacteriota bacterium]